MPADDITEVLEHESDFGEVVVEGSRIALAVSCFQSSLSSHGRANLTTICVIPRALTTK